MVTEEDAGAEEATGVVGSIHGAVKQRMNHPVIGTFILSYLVLNWAKLIPIVFLYKSTDLKADIPDIANGIKVDSLWCPVIIAALYGLLFPFAEGLLHWVKSLSRTWFQPKIEANEQYIKDQIQKRKDAQALVKELENNRKILDETQQRLGEYTDLQRKFNTVHNFCRSIQIETESILNNVPSHIQEKTTLGNLRVIVDKFNDFLQQNSPKE